MSTEMDLSKPFFRMLPEEDGVIGWESNQPNDQHGDFAFEWDIDGSKRREWDEYVADLEAKGVRGNLVYSKWVLQKNEAFDNSSLKETFYPLESYKMVIHDFGEIDLWPLKRKKDAENGL